MAQNAKKKKDLIKIDNPMSQKYPEGAIIVKEDTKRKVLGCCGEVRFLSADYQSTTYSITCTVADLEGEGWTVEETPWVPKEGEQYYAVCGDAAIDALEWCNDSLDTRYKRVGNLYRTREEAQAAAERVRKAYKGEK